MYDSQEKVVDSSNLPDELKVRGFVPLLMTRQ